MTEEEKIAAETAKAEAEADAKAKKEKEDAEFEASLEGLSEEEADLKRAEKEALNLDSTVDYESELAAEKDRKEKAHQAFLEREKRRKEKEAAGGDDGADAPISERRAREILTESNSEAHKTILEGKAESIARELSSNETEVQAVLAKWRNRQFPEDMSLTDQIEEMHAAVNRKKILGTNRELTRALRNKEGIRTDIASTHRDPLESTAPKLPEGSPLKSYTYDKNRRVYFKKLASGKTMYVNPKPMPGERRSWTE